MKRLFRLTCLLLAITIASLMGLGWTEPGLKTLTFGAQLLSGGLIRFGAVDGALFLSFQMDDVVLAMPDAEVKLGRVASSWQFTELFDRRLHITELAIGDVEVRVTPRDDENGDSTENVELPSVRLPGMLLLDHVAVEGVRILGSNYALLTRIDHLTFGVSGSGSRYELHDFVLRAPGYDGDLEGLLDMEKQWYLELGGKVEYRDYGVGPFSGDVRLKGPLARLEAVVDVVKPARGHIEGEILELPHNFKWNAQLKLDDVQLADGHEILPEIFFSVTGTAEGQMLEYGGRLEGKLDYLIFHDVACMIEVHGNEDQIEFPKITVANAQGKAQLTNGFLSWEEDLTWSGHLVTDKVDPAMLLPEYPGAISAELYNSGQYSKKNGLQLDANFPSFSGVLRGYEVAGHGRLEVDPHRFAIDDLLLQNGKAVLRFEGMAENETGLVNWRDELSWKTGMTLEDFDPALFFPEYPGALSTRIVSEGVLEAEDIRAKADIETLSGMVRGYPVRGKGIVRLEDEFLHIDNLLLQSGRSTLEVGGQAGERFDITAKLGSEDLGEFLAGAGGKVDIAAILEGERSTPHLEITGTAGALHVNDITLDKLLIDLRGGISTEDSFAATLKGSGLQFGEFSAKNAEFSLSGLPRQHTFSAKMELKDGNASLEGDGSLAEDYGWGGTVHDFRIHLPATGVWQQRGRADLSATASAANFSDFCLQAGKEKICLEGDWAGESETWHTSLNWKDMELSRLNSSFALAQPLRGLSNGTLSVSGSQAAIDTAKGSVTITNAGFGDQEQNSEFKVLELNQAEIQLNLQGERLKTELSADFANDSTFEGTIVIADFGSVLTSPLALPVKGEIHADLKDLAFVTPLTQYYVRPSGTLQGSLNLAGTVGNPTTQGRLKLVDGQLEMVTLGVTLSDVSFGVEGAESGVAISAAASSGPGYLQAEGKLLFTADGIAGDFHFVGENFDTANLPEYVLRTSPDLFFSFDEKGGTLTGKVQVPYAVIAPERMTDSVSVSEDVIYLDGEEKEDPGSWQFSTSLDIALGDDVRLEGYGITGLLRGALQVEKVPGSQMLGRGQLSLADGIFSIYGRSLAIERSRLLFAGGPVDNPGVDVRAKKIVADNTQPNETLEVGVEVSGVADKLEFSLFSNPPMEESDILAYMVVGRAMSDVGQQDESLLNSAAMALGMNKQMGALGELTELLPVDEFYIEGDEADEMSLVVGKHLTRELFIGYGHNFFDQEGEMRLRYSLGAGFSIETRSSGERTGADLLYSFEK